MGCCVVDEGMLLVKRLGIGKVCWCVWSIDCPVEVMGICHQKYPQKGVGSV